ncbi:LysR family transcriptional regulator [Polaromonas eurypsychrophila]|uniref:LysR family transcriptional regulator n=1 Tax=Polaromonas eurypsychrophila TaxID=1614635 RepID=A0A916SS77_9BURK|nr:LysR family transcriptional regulator [Polaromonas eurypsychrophila]GGB13822.1 LysR family transcriptional regulator [Polaromonas eurypsychrophila]
MDPRHLIQLATILEKGSITQASQHLHLTQPTLTHNMQTLEMQVGGKLFERSRFGVRSTALGDMLAREGRAIARRLKDAAEVSARHRGGVSRTVRIGVGPLIGAAFLPGVVEELLRQQPAVHVTVQSDRPHLLVEQLIDGRHDIVIAPSWLDRPPPGIERFLLVEDDLGVFCGASHPLAASGVLSPGSSEGQGWISLGTASPFEQHVREMLEEAGVVTPRSEITVLGEAMLLLRLLAQGRHLSVLPRFPTRLLQQYFPIVELALRARPQSRNIHLWCRSTMLEDPAFAAIKNAILAHAARAGEKTEIGKPVSRRKVPKRRLTSA